MTMPSDRLIPADADTNPDSIGLTFHVELDREAWRAYMAEYPDFKGETPAETLIREAIAAWEWDGLVVGQRTKGIRSA